MRSAPHGNAAHPHTLHHSPSGVLTLTDTSSGGSEIAKNKRIQSHHPVSITHEQQSISYLPMRIPHSRLLLNIMARHRTNLGLLLLASTITINSGCATSSRSVYELHATATIPTQESLTPELAQVFHDQPQLPGSILVATSVPERIPLSYPEMMQRDLLDDHMATHQSR